MSSYKHIIDVENGVVVLTDKFDYEADLSYLISRDVRIVVYTADGDYWFEKIDFNGREQEINIKAKADELIAEAQAAYDAEQPQPLTDAEKLAKERDEMIVSAFQAKAALMQSNYYDQVVSYMETSADAVTKLAWDTATEFRRRSPTVASLASLLSLSETDIDDLFRLAATIEA